MSLALCLLVGLTGAGEKSVVVGLGEGADIEARVTAQTAQEKTQGFRVLTDKGARQRLTGLDDPREPLDVPTLRRYLLTATEADANWESDAARALRDDVLDIFGRAARPDPAIASVAVLAQQDIATALLAEGKEEAALEAARESIRRFGVDQDLERHPPHVVALFEKAIAERDSPPKGEITVTSSEPGDVWIDGWKLGRSGGQITRTIPAGAHRVWMSNDDGSSFGHPIEVVAGGNVSVTIELGLERCVEVEPIVRLTCADRYQRDLNLLVEALDAERVVGVGDQLEPLVATAETLREMREADAAAANVGTGVVADVDWTDWGAPHVWWRPLLGVVALGVGLALDTAPASAKNQKSDPLDFVPVGLYGAALGALPTTLDTLAGRKIPQWIWLAAGGVLALTGALLHVVPEDDPKVEWIDAVPIGLYGVAGSLVVTSF